jgi:single-stranded DNA-binding protein
LADDLLIRVVAFDETMTSLESLHPGDAVSIQGVLQIETRQGKLTGLFVIAGQVMPLRKRSPNRVPMAAMAAMA